ncbi:NnrS family protein [Denitromonas iodatirespirans]|uniref:NnrS family protein n=1 Tax=Denitromonas iodatirespirans TaxID=2795389 RepID=A0A944DSY1_DENI1|nr:NnrS family protein [Denitromonas iodatirespirans]MBT0963889.1 NnrS family protein [Denitromonas iodatirespirans]
MAIIRLEEPRPRLPISRPGWSPLMAMAFRPFYLVAAVFGAVAILAWVAGFNGTDALPGMLWHGHEMIWGYAGAVIVGFLLTAVASWTGQPAFSGTPLALLAALWVGARIAASTETGSLLLTGALSVAFFVSAAVAVGLPILRARSRRNAGVPFLLLAFGAADVLYLLTVAGVLALDARRLLFTGLLLVAGFITLIGLRVIPFFTHRALQRPQVAHPRWAGMTALLSPMVLAALVAADAPSPLALVVGLAGMVFNLVLLARNAHGSMRRHPLLWVLYLGYTLTALGLGLVGAALSVAPALMSAAVHCIAIGGIGVLTLGMMTRTALGHTGRKLELPPLMVPAYALMLLATVLRVAAAFVPAAYQPLIHAAGACFAGALLLFLWRYGLWLVSTRADGMPG